MKKKKLSLDFRFYTINKESKRKTKEKYAYLIHKILLVISWLIRADKNVYVIWLYLDVSCLIKNASPYKNVKKKKNNKL